MFDQSLDEGKFNAWRELQLCLCGTDMLRISGILDIQGRPGPVAIHGVQHVQHPPRNYPTGPATTDARIWCSSPETLRGRPSKNHSALSLTFGGTGKRPLPAPTTLDGEAGQGA